MYFLNPRTQAIPFFISSKILPIHLLYFEAVLHSMYEVSNNSTPKDISETFVKTSLIHSYNTRAASCGKYHIQFSRLNLQRNSFSCFGEKAWNCLPSQVCNLPKQAFKKSIRKALFAALIGDEDYIEASNILSKLYMFFSLLNINKQLLDEVEHDIMNYQNRGLCYLPKPNAEADNTDTRV